MKKKDTLTEDLVPICYTHNTFYEGGRKIHILNLYTSRCLCGYNPWFFNEIDTSPVGGLTGFVTQPDPDGNLCLRCKEIAVKRLIGNAKDNV